MIGNFVGTSVCHEEYTEFWEWNFLINIDYFKSFVRFPFHRSDDKFAETKFSLSDVNDSVLKVNDKETK